MPKHLSQNTSPIWFIVFIAFGIAFGTAALFFTKDSHESKEPQNVPVISKRPLAHITPQKTYDYDLDIAFKNAKRKFPSIKIVKEIPSDYVRPRRKRQHMMEASEPETLVVLYAEFPEEPLDMCITPCKLNANVSEKYNIIVYKYGFEPLLWWVDTGIWPAEDVMTVPLGADWLNTYKEQRKCFDKNKARLTEDQDAIVCNRIPPTMPPSAQKSGHCNVMFNVSKTGYPTDVEALNCTNPIFRAPAVHSTRLWYYHPKVENNSYVERRNMRTKISFKLTDETGELIPE